MHPGSYRTVIHSVMQLKGLGSTAAILQAGIPACGPSLIHVIDTVLLPFTLDKSSIQAASQVPDTAG